VGDDLLLVNDPILEGSNYQDPYSSQDPYDESMKLLATTSEDKPTDGRPKEDSNAISALQSCTNNSSYSPYITPALTATVPHESVAAINSQSATLALTLDNPRQPLQVAVADNKQE
jgi:hypothetical protein